VRIGSSIRGSATQKQSLRINQQAIQSIDFLSMDFSQVMDRLTEFLDENPLLICRTPESLGILSYDDIAGFTPSSAPESLEECLLRQFSMSGLDEDSLTAAAALVADLDSDGFITSSLSSLSRASKVPLDVFKSLMTDVVPHLVPSGICAVDHCHSLLIQVSAMSPQPPAAELAKRLLSHGDFGSCTTAALSETMGVSPAMIAEAKDLIRSCSLSPAIYFNTDADVSHIPCARVRFLSGEPIVEIAGMPWHTLELDSGVVGLAPTPESKEFLSSTVTALNNFQAMVSKRDETITKVIMAIFARQKAFFRHGPQAIAPLKMSEIASDISAHESTVSRAISGKYISTDFGPIPLKDFFKRAASTRFKGGISTTDSVRERISSLVSSEDPSLPYTDLQLSEMLLKEGIKVARRTVTKYRKMLGIFPATDRRAA